jgi:hypothetical protein
MKNFLLQLGKYFETVISYGGDKPVIRTDDEPLCCKHVKKMHYCTGPELGIVRLNINYCFVCGKKLER